MVPFPGRWLCPVGANPQPSPLQAPLGVQVLMSATRSVYVEEEGVYHFHMEHPVPAYLVALVAGDLKPADIGPR